MRKLIINSLALLAIALFAVAPARSNAQSVGDLQDQIAALMAQVQVLQAKLLTLPAASNANAGVNTSVTNASTATPAFCHTFEVNMQRGSTGDEVVALQKALEINLNFAGHPLLNVEAGTFGNFTFNAVVDFQEKYRADVLTPVGLTKGNGIVRGYTRTKLNQLFACPPTSTPPGPQTPPTSTTPAAINVTSPAAAQVFALGGVMNIQWTPSSVGVARIDLVPVAGGEVLTIYGRKVLGYPVNFTGSFIYTIPNNATLVRPGSYYLKFFNPEADMNYNYDRPVLLGQSAVFTIAMGPIGTPPAPGTPLILQAGVDLSTPPGRQAVIGSTGNPLVAFRLENVSSREDVKVTDLRIAESHKAEPGVLPSFSNLTLYNGTTVLGVGSPLALAGDTTYSSAFHLAAPVVIPKNSSVVLVVKGDVPPNASTENSVHYFGLLSGTDVTAIGTPSNSAATVKLGFSWGNAMTVVRNGTPAPPTPTTSATGLTVLWPNGGETLFKSQSATMTWLNPGQKVVNLLVVPVVNPNYSAYTIAANLPWQSGDKQSFNWTVGAQVGKSTFDIPDGKYYFQVCPPIPYKDGECGRSSGSFMIVAPTPPTIPTDPGPGPKPTTPTSSFVGSLDGISSSGVIAGWAADANNQGRTLMVSLYGDGTIGTGKLIGEFFADEARADVNSSLGYAGNHGFNVPVPAWLKDNKSHSVYAYMVASGSTRLPAPALLSGSPKGFKIDPAVPTQTGSILNSLQSILQSLLDSLR